MASIFRRIAATLDAFRNMQRRSGLSLSFLASSFTRCVGTVKLQSQHWWKTSSSGFV